MDSGGCGYYPQLKRHELKICQDIQPGKLCCYGLDGTVCNAAAYRNASAFMYRLACRRRHLLHRRYRILRTRQEKCGHALRMARIRTARIDIPVHKHIDDIALILSNNTFVD